MIVSKIGAMDSLFFFTLTALIGLLILVGALLKTDLRDFFGAALLLGFGFLLVWFIGAFCRAFRREKPSKYSRLSSDEVAKARSKQ